MKDNQRIAHLILTHKDPDLVLRTVKSLVCPEMDFYIHVDSKSNIHDFAGMLGNLPQVHFIKNRANIHWAGYGTIQATVNGFIEILRSGINYDYLHVMSGQDYPIKSSSYILNYLNEHAGKEFFDLIHSRWPDDIATRYSKYHFVNNRFPGKYRFGNLISKLLPKRSFYFDDPVWGSSNWFMVTNDCARYLIDQINNNKSLVRYFKRTWGPDEFIFINILLHSPFKDKIDGGGIHFMEWEDGEGHARILTMGDIDHLRKSDKLFARKFDINISKDILDKIDEWILANQFIP